MAHGTTDKEFKDPYNVFYFIGLLLALVPATLVASLTMYKVLSGGHF
ncbi:MAG: hypothetical protein JKY55_11745 [Aliivibrio sp.]|nr:hypothetical protein [Aliivibrio sp.]